MDRYPLYIFDLDGTLYRGNAPTPGAVEVLQTLRRDGSQIRFLTNNSTQTTTGFVEKLARLGFEAYPHEVIGSALATGEYLSGQVSRVFVVGEEGLRRTLASFGIAAVEDSPDAVVVGLCRSFTYDLMAAAMAHLLDGRVRFVATNLDSSYPLEGGVLIPGAGSLVAAIAACSGREPEGVGKPNPFMVELAMRGTGAAPEETLVVGDRIETDIEAGRRARCPVHLVLCGVTAVRPDGISASADLRGLL